MANVALVLAAYESCTRPKANIVILANIDINFHCDFDLNHFAKNGGSGTPFDSKLKKFHALSAGCATLAHGSKLSPGRITKLRECVEEWVLRCDPATNEVLHTFLPDIEKQMVKALVVSDCTPARALP